MIRPADTYTLATHDAFGRLAHRRLQVRPPRKGDEDKIHSYSAIVYDGAGRPFVVPARYVGGRASLGLMAEFPDRSLSAPVPWSSNGFVPGIKRPASPVAWYMGYFGSGHAVSFPEAQTMAADGGAAASYSVTSDYGKTWSTKTLNITWPHGDLDFNPDWDSWKPRALIPVSASEAYVIHQMDRYYYTWSYRHEEPLVVHYTADKGETFTQIPVPKIGGYFYPATPKTNAVPQAPNHVHMLVEGEKHYASGYFEFCVGAMHLTPTGVTILKLDERKDHAGQPYQYYWTRVFTMGPGKVLRQDNSSSTSPLYLEQWHGYRSRSILGTFPYTYGELDQWWVYFKVTSNQLGDVVINAWPDPPVSVPTQNVPTSIYRLNGNAFDEIVSGLVEIPGARQEAQISWVFPTNQEGLYGFNWDFTRRAVTEDDFTTMWAPAWHVDRREHWGDLWNQSADVNGDWLIVDGRIVDM